MVLKGWVKASALRFLRSPFAGRVTGGAEPGTAVKQGDTILKLDPGLQLDWLTEVEAELERRKCERNAAELQLEMEEMLAPLRVEAAQAVVGIAQRELEILRNRPLPSERIAAENALAEARWRLEANKRALAEFRQLAEQGLASAAEVKQRELQVASARAAVETTQAGLEEITRGASDLELAMATADLRLGRAGRRKAEAIADAAVHAAKAQLEAARAELEVYREHAARQRAKAEKAELESPISGILLWRAQEGREVREDWWLAVIADTTRTQVHAAMDEPDVFKIPLGASARVRLAGLPGRVFTGKVSSISDWRLPWWHWKQETDGKERPGKLFEVVVEMEGGAPPCLGMSALVEIEPMAESAPFETSSFVAGNTDTR
jgi:multidrug resistance efflux pump